MSSDDTDRIDDKELDAFLRGDDALSRQLGALAQAQPPAALDDAILARAQQAVRPAAANDPAPGWQPSSRRWRVPAGLAAMLLAGVLTHRTWEETDQMAQVDAPAVATAASAPPPPVEPQGDTAAVQPPAADATPPSPPAPQVKQKPKAAAVERKHEQLAAPPAPVAVPAPAPAAPPAPAPAPVAQAASPAPAAPAPAAALSESTISHATNVKPRHFDQHQNAVSVTGARRAMAAPAPAVGTGATPEDWLGLIEEMLDAGLVRDTLTEWDAFRAAHPEYAVDPALEQRINALRKR